MVFKSVLAAAALCLCAQFILADNFAWLNDEEAATFSVMCEKDVEYSEAPLPPDHCDIEKYIACQNGKAVIIIECPVGRFFNRTTKWCEPDVNVTRPPGCAETTKVKTYPKTCSELKIFPDTVLDPEDCRKYKMCLQPGRSETMPCPSQSFYEPMKKSCISLNFPYNAELTDDFIRRCKELKSYKDSQKP